MANMMDFFIGVKMKSTPLTEAEKKAKKLTEQLGKTDNKLKQITGSSGQANAKMKNLSSSMGNQNNMASSLGSTVKNLVTAYVSFQTLKQTIQIFTKFEDKMLRVKGLLGDAAETEFPKLEAQAKLLGKTTAFSASQVADAQGNLIQGGLKANEVLQATPGILNAASAAQLDMATASEIVVGQLNAFNLEASKSTMVADVLTKAQSISATSVLGLGDSLTYVGGAASDMKYSLEDTVAILGVLADNQIKGSMAGTSLNAALTDISKNKDKLKALGVSVADSNGEFRKLEDITKDLTFATRNLTTEQKKETLQNIFGERSLRAIQKLMGANSDKVKEYKEQLQSSAGYSQRMAQIMESGLGGALRNAWSATEGLAIEFGQFLAPALMGVLGVVSDGLNYLSDFVNFMNSGTLAGDAMTAIVWGLTGAFAVNKAIMIANAVTATGLTVAQTALTAVTGGLTAAFNLLNLSNPLGWVIIGISAVVILWKRFEGFRNFLKGTWELLKKFFEYTPLGLLIKTGVALANYFGGDKPKNTTVSNGVQGSSLSNPINVPPTGIPNGYVPPTINTTAKPISNINTNNQTSNQTSINVNVNNSVDGAKLGKAIEKGVKKGVDEYNSQQLGMVGVR